MKELIAVIITLGLVALIVTQQAPKDTSQALPKLPTFAVQDVDSIAVYAKDKTRLQAKRDGDKWIVEGADKPVYVQSNVVNQLLQDLQTMQVKRVASRTEDNFSRFSVLTDHVVLKNKQGEVLLDVFVGKPATDLASTYIRLADENMVVTVDKVLTWQVKRTHDAWLEQKAATKDTSTE
ncbi:DUF4340 domain-containing protein [Ghiorsea bivora]|uniref:DUF4340 domain-containing protein n=1 Tax=Ghiorsea bivora TaxID=1485545 RepID=UPI00068B5C45|nr:DUF4340 domain-containing protein [Ghiorsea bivora]